MIDLTMHRQSYKTARDSALAHWAAVGTACKTEARDPSDVERGIFDRLIKTAADAKADILAGEAEYRGERPPARRPSSHGVMTDDSRASWGADQAEEDRTTSHRIDPPTQPRLSFASSLCTHAPQRGVNGHATEYGAMRCPKTGVVVPVLGRADRFTDLAASDPNMPRADEMPPHPLGEFVRSLITGESMHPAIQAAASTTNNASAGVLVPNILSAEVIDLARSQTRVLQAGARVIPMESATLTIAALTADNTVEVKAENAAATGSDMTWDARTLVAYTLLMLETASREVASDGIDFAAKVEASMAKKLAAQIDRYALQGTGSAEPLGIINFVGVNELTSVGSPDWDDVIDAVNLCQVDDTEPTVMIAHPNTMKSLWKLLVNSEVNHYAERLTPQVVQDLLKLPTTNIPAANAIVGDFSNLLIGLRQAPLIEVTTSGGNNTFGKHQVAIKMTWRGGFTWADPEAFCVLSGIS